jgi:hypothetical protein
MPNACKDIINWREAGYMVGLIVKPQGEMVMDGRGPALARTADNRGRHNVGFAPNKRFTQNFLRKKPCIVSEYFAYPCE